MMANAPTTLITPLTSFFDLSASAADTTLNPVTTIIRMAKKNAIPLRRVSIWKKRELFPLLILSPTSSSPAVPPGEKLMSPSPLKSHPAQ